MENAFEPDEKTRAYADLVDSFLPAGGAALAVALARAMWALTYTVVFVGTKARTGIDVPQWLTDAASRAAYVCLESDWHEAAAAIASRDDNFLSDLPPGLAVGDILITVLDGTPALVACVERLDAFGPEGPLMSRLVLSKAVPWPSVVGRRRLDADPSGLLEDCAAVLEQLAWLIVHPPSVMTQADGCGDRSPAIQITALLAAEDGSAMRCAVCDEPMHASDAIAHHGHNGVVVDLADAANGAHLVCSPCHELLHEPTITALRRRLRPTCPHCEVREYVVPIMWGMLAGPLEDDEAVVGGCDLPHPTPRWLCRSCGAGLLVTSTDPARNGAGRPVPVRRRERPLLNLTDVGRSLGREADQLSIEDALSNYADTDVSIDDPGDNGFTVVLGGLGLRLAYPFSAASLWDSLDGLTVEWRAACEPGSDDL